MNKTNIKAPTGLCGSGKSTLNYNNIPTSNSTHLLYLSPSTEFAKEVESNLKQLNISCKVITSDKTDFVIDNILQYIRDNSKRTTKEVLIITHHAYEMMDVNKFKHTLPDSTRQHYSLIFDEEFACDEEIICTFGTHVKFANLFNFNEVTKEITLLEGIDSQPTHSDISLEVRRVIQGLITGRFKVYEQGRQTKSDNEEYITLYKVINEKYFGEATDITITTALLQYTMLYHVMKDKFNFIIEELESKNDNHLSDKIKIKYVLEYDNTKHLRLKDPYAYHRLVDVLTNEIPHNEKCLMLINKDFKHNFNDNFIKLPNNSLGQNKEEWTAVNNSLMIGAYNFSPTGAAMRKELFNMTDLDLYLARTFSAKYYQSIMRSSLRLNEEYQGGQILVVDRRAADALKIVFPNATIEKIDHNITFNVRAEQDNIELLDSKKASNIRKCGREGKYKGLDADIAQLPTKELINSSLWNKVTSKGTYKKETKK